MRIGAPDASLTRFSGAIVVTELVDRLAMIKLLDAAIGPIKSRDRGFSGGQLLVGIAAAQLAGEDFLVGLDRQRADEAGQVLAVVPGLASTTAAGLARKFTDGQWQAVETGLAEVAAAALAALAAGCTTRTGTLVDATPECQPGRRLAVLAQAVPTAAYVPCIADEDSPWRFTSLTVKQGRARLSLVYIDPSGRSARVQLTRSCDTGGASDLPEVADEPDVDHFRRASTLSPRLAGVDYAVFRGGCVTTEFDLPRNADASERLLDLDTTVGLYPRDRLTRELDREYHLELDGPPDAT